MSSDNESLSEDDAQVIPLTDNLEDNSNREIVESENPSDNKANDTESKKTVKQRKKPLYPFPKFNEQTLKTPKGLPALVGHFKDVKFKGRGYEEHDLNRLMKIYEYWSHRFYPKFTFDECIGRFEWLGKKKATQIYLKKIRMGIEEIIDETKETIDDNDDIFGDKQENQPDHTNGWFEDEEMELASIEKDLFGNNDKQSTKNTPNSPSNNELPANGMELLGMNENEVSNNSVKESFGDSEQVSTENNQRLLDDENELSDNNEMDINDIERELSGNNDC